jgi:tetratricopeptide (TPR) repeat protein
MIFYNRRKNIFERGLLLNILFSIVIACVFSSCVGLFIGGPNYTGTKATAARTQQAIATVIDYYQSKNSSYTKITFDKGGTTWTVRLNYCIDHSAYDRGDKLFIEYDPYNLANVKLLYDRPYFEPGDLPDTTEGMIHSVYNDSIYKSYVFVIYKRFEPSDSFDVEIMRKTRYFSQKMFDTLKIKENYVYKILYNKNKTSSTWCEVLFTEIKDSSHPRLNRHLYGALDRLTNANPITAIGDLNYCIMLDPGNPYYFFQRAKAHENVRENENALEDINKYIQMVPNDKRGYVRRAGLYIMKSRYDEAQKDVNKLFSLDEESGEAHYLQGDIYYHKKEYQKAIDAYSRALHFGTGKQREVYYYDRALAREKLLGKGNVESKSDYLMAKRAADQFGESALHGHHTHEGKLHYGKHSVYCAVTSDNTLSSYSTINSHMQGEVIFPATISTGPTVFDYHFLLNTNYSSNAISLGVLSVELGGFKRWYGRLESGAILNNGRGAPGSLKAALGFNIKTTEKDIIIIRPELGCTYQNRQITINRIQFNGAPQIFIMQKKFTYSSKNGTDEVSVSFRENVFNFSPAIGIWLWPYSSRFALRLNAGYNWCISQKYSLYFSSNKDHLREHLGNPNLTFSNTNGHNNNFFRYQGLFVSIGLGVRF